MMTASRNSPLHLVHEQLGAHFTDFAGWSMPVRYTSEIAEHTAVRSAAGLFDLSHMGELELNGPEAGAALDHALVSRPSQIGVGRARYSMICDEDGGILDDLVVYRLAQEHYLVVANASNVRVVLDALHQRVAGFDTELRDASDAWALIAMQGPTSAEIVAGLTDLDVSSVKYYSIDRGTLPLGPAADTLRLEAGMPLYGQELSRDVTPFEAGLGRVVSFDKEGGFVGDRALVVRRDAGVRRTLVGLASHGRRSPRTGYAVLDPTTGEPVGQVTSGAPSPTLGHPVAMAYVAVGLDQPGTRLLVDIRGVREDVEVVTLPFYRRPA